MDNEVTSPQSLSFHLVGSVPLADTHEVFKSVADSIGECVHAVPDGETGKRSMWLLWQGDILARNPQLESIASGDDYSENDVGFRPKKGITAEEIELGSLGYAEAALASYQSFRELKDKGRFADDTRFQVSLPTPLAVSHVFFTPDSVGAMDPIYEQAILREIRTITDAIPADQLAIQWDVAIEIMLLEMQDLPLHFDDRMAGITERLVRMLDSIPVDVEVGMHLCYGDSEHKHFKEPEDTARLVEMSNAVSSGVGRPLNWIHLPVPIDRTDDAYFAPLEGLTLRPETRLYLGLVHLTDGVDGTHKRIETARKFVGEFGIGTECGFGRRDPATIHALLDVHAGLIVD